MKEKYTIIFLVVFSGILFLTGLGRMPLTDPDETFYAETAREMLARGEFLTPYIFGKPQFEKPPLFYWLVEGSFKALGINEFSARLPSALFGIAGVIAMYFLGKLLFGARCGFISGLVLATSIEYIVLSRACVTDMALCVFILCAMTFFLYGYRKDSGKKAYYYLSSLFFAMAVLTKGPVGVALPVFAVFVYMLSAKELKKIREIPLISGAILFLIVALPWYALMQRMHGSALANEFFGFHNIVRFLVPEHESGSEFYYNVPIFFGTFFPWSVFFPFALWTVFTRKNGSQQDKKHYKFLLIWILAFFIFFSISRTKLPTYIFPLYPAAALFVGRFWDVFLGEKDDPGLKRSMLCSFLILVISVIGAAIGLYVVGGRRYPDAVISGIPAAAIFIIGFMLSFWVFIRKRYFFSFLALCATLLFAITTLSVSLLPEVGRYVSSRDISKEITKRAMPQDKIGAETQYKRGIAYYAGREDVIDVHKHHIITKLLDEPERIWCVIKEKNHIQLYTDEKAPFKSPTYVVYEFGKKVLMTNKVPRDGKFIKKRTLDEPF